LNWDTDFNAHFVKGKLIGQGSFGSVYLGIDLHTGQQVAIKVMPKQRGKLTKDRTLQKLVKEVGILQRIQECPNVVRLLGCYEDTDHVMLVTELCEGGDLQKLSDDRGALPERAVALIGYEVLKVVAACHRNNVLHGDVKPANFVLKDKVQNPLYSSDINHLFTPWLIAIDFGCSQYLGTKRFTKRTGTPVYMAPEIFERDYQREADMWSVGIMLYQLFARRFPFWDTYEACRSARLEEVQVLVQEGPLPFSYGPWLGMSAEGLDFMHGCLDRDYHTRLTVNDALYHPWFEQWLPEASDGSMGLDSYGTDDEDDGRGGLLLPQQPLLRVPAGAAGVQQGQSPFQLQQQQPQQQFLQQPRIVVNPAGHHRQHQQQPRASSQQLPQQQQRHHHPQQQQQQHARGSPWHQAVPQPLQQQQQHSVAMPQHHNHQQQPLAQPHLQRHEQQLQHVAPPVTRMADKTILSSSGGTSITGPAPDGDGAVVNGDCSSSRPADNGAGAAAGGQEAQAAASPANALPGKQT